MEWSEDWRDPDSGSEGPPPWAADPSPVPSSPEPARGTGRMWPVAIALSLAVVVFVNLAFVYIAVSGADEVVPSYVEEER